MNIKKFLKPDRRKIIAFLGIGYIFTYFLPAPLQQILSYPVVLIVLGFTYIIDFIWEGFLISDYGFTLLVFGLGVLSLFYLYLISCFIILIYDKAEKKFLQNRL